MVQDEIETRVAKAKLCLAGEPAVGKSSLIKRFVLDVYEDRYVATLGTKVVKKTVSLVHPKNEKDIKVDLIVWDVMGTRSVRDLLKEAYYHGANGVMAVCDLSRRDTLYELDSWLKAIESVAGSVPTQVVANKIDLVEDREISEEDLKRFCDSRGWKVVMTSAKTGENVEKAFCSIGQAAINRILGENEITATH